MSKIGELIVGALAPVITSVGSEQLANLFRKIEPAETRHGVLKSLYVPTVTILEPYTDKTKTKLDDLFIDPIKLAIETVAAEDGIELPTTADPGSGSVEDSGTSGKPSEFVADPGNNS